MRMDDHIDTPVLSVTEIGSSSVRMRVVQVTGDGWRELESLERPVRIGREVFTSRRIRFDSVALLSRILKDYAQVMREYGVSRSRTVATTALREAENRDYVVDLIRVQNGVSIDVLEETRESAMVIGRILDRHPEAVGGQGALIAYLGTGNVGLAYTREGRVQFSSSLPTGVQRLSDLLSGLQDQTGRYHDVLREYVRTLLGHIRIQLEGPLPDRLVVNGHFVREIASLAGIAPQNGLYRVGRSSLKDLFETLRMRGTPAGSEEDPLLPALAVVSELIDMTSAEELCVPDFSFSDAVIDEMASRDNRSRNQEALRINALESARHMASVFRCDPAHAAWVAQCALNVFDTLRKPHGLGRRARQLLELSAHLHDVGYFVNTRNHRKTAFEILRETTLFGLGEDDMFLIACIAGFDENEPGVDRFRQVPFRRDKDRIVATKLAAILQLANALDQSHTQRLGEPRAELTGGRLMLRCRSDQDAALERWALRRWTPAFEDVFGIRPELIVESALLL